MKKKIIISTLIIILIAMLLNIMKIGALLTALAVPFNQSAVDKRPATTETAATQTLYDFKMTALDGKQVIDLSKYKGKKVIILNTASKCGYTPQYADWQKFHETMGDKVVVLGFPANEFGSQEPGTNAEIGSFCQKNHRAHL